MARKKLQVFVSSTYTDMLAERQSAVEAILQAGHIPAGMELFAAGDNSQLEVIRKWIDDSDVFVLILGGRYGSIDKSSGKSYIHLEYEHAIARKKPFFAIVATDECVTKKAKKDPSVMERQNAPKFDEFKAGVLSKICRQFGDVKDIKLAIHESLAVFADRDLIGWVKANEVSNSQPLVDEIGRLGEENQRLKAEVASLREALERRSSDKSNFGDFSFDEVQQALKVSEIWGATLRGNALDALLQNEAQLVRGVDYHDGDLYNELGPRLVIYELAELIQPEDPREPRHYVLTRAGRRFIALCRVTKSKAQ